jgi:quercetin dioxygenase-like cupin family protein
MRWVVTGVDAEGRSCVVEERELLGDAAVDQGEAVTEDLWLTGPAPFTVPAPRRAADEFALDLGFPIDGAKWMVVHFKAGGTPFMHRTDTLDFDVVLAGAPVLHLEAEVVALAPGDCVVIPGVVHGWSAGPDGGTVAVVGLGLRPVD